MTDRPLTDSSKAKWEWGKKPGLAAAARNGGEQAAHATSADTNERVLNGSVRRETPTADRRREERLGGATARTSTWRRGGQTSADVFWRRSDVGVAAMLVVVGDTATTDGFSSESATRRTYATVPDLGRVTLKSEVSPTRIAQYVRRQR